MPCDLLKLRSTLYVHGENFYRVDPRVAEQVPFSADDHTVLNMLDPIRTPLRSNARSGKY